MKTIKKLKLHNFKKFTDFQIEFDDRLNLLIGDNEAGKSSILTALDLVLSGSRSKVESIGLEALFNRDSVLGFLETEKKYETLPTLYIEIYLVEQKNFHLNGKDNSDEEKCDGLQLICEPIAEFSKEIEEILKQEEPNFPFEYYSITFRTFAGEHYTGYRRFIRHLLLDSSQINNEYATREYIRTIYNSLVTDSEKNKHQNEYRKYKDKFKDEVFHDLNKKEKERDYSFGVRSGSRANLESDISISENGISLENKGKGKQCFIKTEFALKKKNENKDLDVILLEEPENHLSHVRMKKLIRIISESENRQIFIATHNNLISTRLDLRKSILLNSHSSKPVQLNDLDKYTAEFFIKAPDNNILEYVLSQKVILVEGDAEYMLFEAFYQKVTNESLEDSGIHVISVGGTSFKRYLELAKLLDIRTAVVRDNDGDYTTNCEQRYSDYECDNIKIFADEDNARKTFEICIYKDNTSICDDLFSERRRKLTVLEYMLKNKADAAFDLLDLKRDLINVPKYIEESIKWIRK